MMRSLACALCFVACLVACTSPATPATDASLTDLAPVDVTPSPDAPDAPVDAPRVGPGPLAPLSAPRPLAVSRWLTTTLASTAADDEVLPALETDTFQLPDPVGQTYGLFWDEQPPDPMGALPAAPPGGILYAAGEIDVPEGAHVFARADVMLGVYSHGAVQPGDIYSSGKVRVPVSTRAGRNTVVFRALGFRGTPRAELFATDDEVFVNTDDLTAPDLPVGDTREQYVGVATLNLTDAPALDVTARVESSDVWEGTALQVPSLPAGSVTQVAFRLAPRRAFATPGERIVVGLRIESSTLRYSYRREVTLNVVAADATHRRTFRSPMDLSAQYMGVVPPRPADGDAGASKALVLTLHGASVEAIGQAQAYSAKPDAYIVAATNRRPYGFDWEEYGRRDAIEVLEHATSIYPIDPTRVYLTGHSMGGHGSWHVGVHFPGRFATVGPSAGWGSFYSYTGRAVPRGAFARSQAASDTVAYLSNLARRGVYVIHGSGDTNVPVREGRTMSAAARTHTMDVTYHEQPGANHWWDGDASPGADCVDWPPLFEFMRAHRLDPTETDFRFTSPGVWVNPRHSFVTLRSATDSTMDLSVTASRMGATETVTTVNVRSMELSGSALRAKGITRVVVNGDARDVTDADIAIGPREGKRPGVNGPLNEALQRPFCFVYPDSGEVTYRRYASYLVSVWSVNGNGQGCAVPLGAVTEALRRERNLVFLGVGPQAVRAPASLPFAWDERGVALGDRRFEDAAMVFVFPDGEHLGAAFVTARGSERLLYRIQPFSSGFAVPDYMVWNRMGSQAAGFFTPDWRYVPPS